MKRIVLALLLCGCTDAADTVPMPDTGWESIGRGSYRLEVPGGWVVVYKGGYAGGATFVPDANKEWKR